MTRKALLIGTTILATVASGAAPAQEAAPAATAAPSAQSDPAAPDAAASANDIIVTATRRATSVQNTAAAITALSSETLREKSVATFEDLGRVAPAVQVSNSQGFAQVYIRGIGTPVRGAGLGEASTAFLVDGIYKANAGDAATPFFDVDRVEVLRGPQGTLYGRNATSGAINVVTRDPTSVFEADGRLIAGNYNRFTEQAAVGGPITDAIQARVAFIRNDHDGYTKLIYPDGSTSDAENEHDFAVRGKLKFLPAEGLTILLTGDYFHANDRAVNYHYFGPGFVGQASYEGRFASSTRFSVPDSRTQYTTVPYYNHRNIGGVSAKISYETDGYTFSSTTAYRKVKFQYQNDLGFTNVPIATQHHGENAYQVTEDLLVTSPTGHFFEWIVGGSYITRRTTYSSIT